MRTNNRVTKCDSGMALITTLLLLVLLSSLLVGFFVLITTGQQLTGGAKQETRAFYGAEAGLEKMTADLGTLFDNTYSPTPAELNTITQNPPPNLGDLTFTAADGTSGYTITYPQDSFGRPLATDAQVKSGPYSGMTGLITPYTLTVTSHTASGAEVMLRRTTQTVGIPAFEFGVFCDVECGFHAGPDFNFGGRIHTNRNLYLAEGNGSTLTLSDKVTAFGEVVRDVLMNGQPLSAGGWTGTVNMTTSPGTSSYRALGASEGSVKDNPGTTPVRNPSQPYSPPANESSNWPSISKTTYNSNILNGATGAKKLKLPIEILTQNSLVPGKPIDIIRRPLQGDDPVLLGERYFAQASMKILLSDNPQDIMKLPCIDPTTPAVDLSTLAWDASMPNSYPAADPLAGNHFKGWYSNGNPNPVPIATSAAGIARVGGATGAVPAIGYTTVGNGYWVPKWDPLITGFIKIEIQIGYNPPCGKWQDVTQEILKLGIAGRNLNPGLGINGATQFPNEPPLPAGQIGPSTCPDPSPNAVIRLERVRDNPSNYAANGICGVNFSMTPPIPTNSQDYWPNALFDTREGVLRDVTPAGGNVTAGGIINYVELDANNLGRWLTGQIGKSGPGAFDPQNQPYDYVLYFSDRRGNYVPTGGLTSPWPPVSPSGNETGEYGFNDLVNSNDAANGCPDGKAEQPGEDLAENGVLYTYGMKPTPSVTNGMFADALVSALTPSSCVVTGVWPGYFLRNAQDARMNPPLFFRRALKVVNGSNLKLPLGAVPCPGSTVCGLTIASENPVYVQGDYNANSAGGGFNDAHIGTAILADAVTLLSNKFNDLNSFSAPYNLGQRNATTTWYRVAVLAGKGPGFLWISGTASDFGSDGGMHNYLRYIENWGGQTLNYRGSLVSLFYNRQAVGTYKCCTTVYSPPTRAYNFDTDFLDPALLPPRTPMFRDINTTGFAQILYADQK
jgi:Tfp pilus assembly protein PilX